MILYICLHTYIRIYTHICVFLYMHTYDPVYPFRSGFLVSNGKHQHFTVSTRYMNVSDTDIHTPDKQLDPLFPLAPPHPPTPTSD